MSSKKIDVLEHLHDDDEDEIIHAVGFSMGRCPTCKKVHMAMLDANDQVLAEMVMTDDDWRLALEHMARLSAAMGGCSDR